MVIAVEGVWKHGKVVPLDDLKLEEDTPVIINILERGKRSKSLRHLAGVWKDDDETYETFRRVYSERKNFTLRKWPFA